MHQSFVVAKPELKAFNKVYTDYKINSTMMIDDWWIDESLSLSVRGGGRELESNRASTLEYLLRSSRVGALTSRVGRDGNLVSLAFLHSIAFF